MGSYQPRYIELYKSGDLARRADELEARLSRCNICPRQCFANRLDGKRGQCHSGKLPIMASACDHHGEEPALSGTRGSGTIFFGNCNMSCVYCQNHQISQDPPGQAGNEVQIRTLAEKMIYLQDELQCHNINLVSPTHFVPQIVRAVLEAVPMGLHLPLVYNTGGFDAAITIEALEGIMDIYLPDLRYASDRWAIRYSGAPMYVRSARAAIKEMYRQVGDLALDEDGLAVKGLIVRHLILPGGFAGSEESLTWLAEEVSPSVTVSIMSQYYPTHKAVTMPDLNRTISEEEYTAVVDLVNRLGLENGWLQEMGADQSYRPHFSEEGHPFEGKPE